MTFGDVMDAIRDTLAECPPKRVAEIHNLICSPRIVAVQGSDNGYGNGPRYEYAPETLPELTVAQQNFFRVELLEAWQSTLASAVDSLLGTSNQTIVHWCDDPSVPNGYAVDDFTQTIVELRDTYGGDMKLADLMNGF